LRYDFGRASLQLAYIDAALCGRAHGRDDIAVNRTGAESRHGSGCVDDSRHSEALKNVSHLPPLDFVLRDFSRTGAADQIARRAVMLVCTRRGERLLRRAAQSPSALERR